MRFRLLAGRHVGPDTSLEPIEMTDARGRTSRRYPSKTYTKGQVIETDVDLVATFGPYKFQRMDEDEGRVPSRPPMATGHAFPQGQVSQGHQVATGTEQGTVSGLGQPGFEPEQGGPEGKEVRPTEGRPVQGPPTRRPLHERHPRLDQLTTQQLKELADEEEVDLKGARSKEDMIKTLRAQR